LSFWDTPDPKKKNTVRKGYLQLPTEGKERTDHLITHFLDKEKNSTPENTQESTQFAWRQLLVLGVSRWFQVDNINFPATCFPGTPKVLYF